MSAAVFCLFVNEHRFYSAVYNPVLLSSPNLLQSKSGTGKFAVTTAGPAAALVEWVEQAMIGEVKWAHTDAVPLGPEPAKPKPAASDDEPHVDL